MIMMLMMMAIMIRMIIIIIMMMMTVDDDDDDDDGSDDYNNNNNDDDDDNAMFVFFQYIGSFSVSGENQSSRAEYVQQQLESMHVSFLPSLLSMCVHIRRLSFDLWFSVPVISNGHVRTLSPFYRTFKNVLKQKYNHSTAFWTCQLE